MSQDQCTMLHSSIDVTKSVFENSVLRSDYNTLERRAYNITV